MYTIGPHEHNNVLCHDTIKSCFLKQLGIKAKDILLAITICNLENIIQNNNVSKHKTVSCDEKRERTFYRG